MTFHVLTIFPAFFSGMLDHGVLGRGIRTGRVTVKIHDLRDWTSDRHKTVDDRVFGGGEGMLLKPEPVFAAVESIFPARDETKKVVLMSAQGRLFTQRDARRLVQSKEILLICGRYEGVDERVAEHLIDEELSVGDVVLSGGELPAALMMDAVGRLVPGVLGNEASTVQESFAETVEGVTLLDCPQYTRPAVFRGWAVPDVLLGGNHAEIRQWRHRAAREKTARNRPDLLRPDRNKEEVRT
ncbi:MAG: tRNA (guanosine(37)-N1)-methyltransferase TrmD [Bryobacterales bacterium]|nr:tRNA (guanosine(37)-N1)-methyltransferase TrmD [Bryobacterales bacterium]